MFLSKTTSLTSLAVPGRNDEDGEIDLQFSADLRAASQKFQQGLLFFVAVNNSLNPHLGNCLRLHFDSMDKPNFV